MNNIPFKFMGVPIIPVEGLPEGRILIVDPRTRVRVDVEDVTLNHDPQTAMYSITAQVKIQIAVPRKDGSDE